MTARAPAPAQTEGEIVNTLDAIRAAVRLDEGRWTIPGLTRHMVVNGLNRGATEKILAAKVRMLCDGGALERRLNPDRKGGRLRLWSSNVATERALQVAAGLDAEVARVRAQRATPVRRGDGPATPATSPRAAAIVGERAHRQWVEDNWWTMSPQEQRHWDYDRHVQDANRRAPRRPSSTRLVGNGHPGAPQPGRSSGIGEDGFPLYRRT